MFTYVIEKYILIRKKLIRYNYKLESSVSNIVHYKNDVPFNTLFRSTFV